MLGRTPNTTFRLIGTGRLPQGASCCLVPLHTPQVRPLRPARIPARPDGARSRATGGVTGGGRSLSWGRIRRRSCSLGCRSLCRTSSSNSTGDRAPRPPCDLPDRGRRAAGRHAELHMDNAPNCASATVRLDFDRRPPRFRRSIWRCVMPSRSQSEAAPADDRLRLPEMLHRCGIGSNCAAVTGPRNHNARRAAATSTAPPPGCRWNPQRAHGPWLSLQRSPDALARRLAINPAAIFDLMAVDPQSLVRRPGARARRPRPALNLLAEADEHLLEVAAPCSADQRP